MIIFANLYSNDFPLFFICIEYILIILLLLLFLKKIYDLVKYPNFSYDKIDIIIIYLSSLQLILFLFRLIKNYNIFSTLILINKFSQNFLICALLSIYTLGNNENRKNTIVKYFLISLLILDILIFIIDLYNEHIFEINDKKTIVYLIISIICLLLDGYICYKSFINKKNMSSTNIENFAPKKLNNIIKKEEPLIEEINKGNNENKENEFIDALYYQNLNKVMIIITLYFYILFTFLISYILDIILYFSYTSNAQSNDINNNGTKNNDTMIFNTTNEYNNTEINNTSIFSQNIEEQYTFCKLIICFFVFFFRDIFPYLIIYLMLFYYKLNYYHRSSF